MGILQARILEWAAVPSRLFKKMKRLLNREKVVFSTNGAKQLDIQMPKCELQPISGTRKEKNGSLKMGHRSGPTKLKTLNLQMLLYKIFLR